MDSCRCWSVVAAVCRSYLVPIRIDAPDAPIKPVLASVAYSASRLEAGAPDDADEDEDEDEGAADVKNVAASPGSACLITTARVAESFATSQA